MELELHKGHEVLDEIVYQLIRTAESLPMEVGPI